MEDDGAEAERPEVECSGGDANLFAVLPDLCSSRRELRSHGFGFALTGEVI